MEEKKEKKSIHLRVDQEVFDYFKSRGRGHLTRMQNVLSTYAQVNAIVEEDGEDKNDD